MSEKIHLTTSDGLEIVGDYYKSDGDKFAILLHMMPATKESWKDFAEKLQKAGYSSIAIDERGHGESTQGNTLLYKEFTSEEQQAKIYDVEAAFEYLKGRGATEANTVVIGASIGANLAIQFLQSHPDMKVAIALSPGIDYHGVLTKPLVQNLAESQKVVLVASEEDVGSFKSIKILADVNPDQTIKYELFDLGHGTTITDNKPEFVDELIKLLP